MRIGLSVTPIEWLEAYATIRSESNSNNSGTPRLLQVLGDTAIGAKAFMPNHLGQMFNFGGALDVLFMNGTGGVGLNAGATSFKLKGLSTVDFREPNDQGLPLRVHANVGFFFDNSASIVTQIEDDRAAQKDQRGKKITRLERFGLGINRVDQFQLGIGVEGMFSFVRPFVEWNLGAPVNWRQQYQCNPKQTYSGDTCLGLDESLSVMPSILTLGARVYPYKGLAATAALDLGTGATSKFIEEVAPVPEWDLWLGLSYAVDTQEAPAPKPQVIEKAVASPLGKVRGVVHEKDKTEGVANAIVRYEGRPDLTAMVTSADGVFLSTGLPPGSYTFSVTAEGYKPGQCVAVVAAPVVAPPASPAGAGSPPASPAGSPIAPALPASTVTGDTIVALDCAVEAQPKVGSITGRALDADTGATLTGASVRLMDLQTRELALPVENGTFHVENLNPGMYTLKADAPDHMLHAQQVEVKAREDAKIDLRINKRPTKGDVEIAGNEVKLKRQIHFETDSARILPDSTALLEEIADVLARNPCLQSVEIQGHTDNMGIADHNKSLSEQRANSVRAWLADHGVESSRMVAKGYGQDKPISPNITPAGRERNRRVQFMILQKDKNCGKPGAAAGKMSGGPATTGAAAGAKTAPMPKLPKPPMPF